METYCEFSNPIYWDNTDNLLRNLSGNPVHYQQNQNWNFSKITCSSTDNLASSTIYSYVKNPDTGGEFYIQKTLTYGEAITIWFFTIFSFYLIFKGAYNFFWKK